MYLWHELYLFIKPLRGACARGASFVWLAIAVVGFCAAPDGMGVSSFVRAAYLKERVYHRLLNLFNGKGVRLDDLSKLWMGIVAKRFKPVIVGSKYRLFVADGINVAKEGQKMPAVKSLHNASGNNSKPEFIMGHSFQAIAMMCSAGGRTMAVPLVSRIMEGVKVSNRSTRSLLDKFVLLFNSVVAPEFSGPKLVVADAYYATNKVIRGLMATSTQLISRVKKNCVAYYTPKPRKKGARGRPRVYGVKVQLSELFRQRKRFTTYPSPVYGESKINILVREMNLLWRPIAGLVKFVWVIHPTRGRIILISADLNLSALEVIRVYGLRFKIEVSFKVALRSIGVYCYRFWLKAMPRIERRSKGQYLHRSTPEYRAKVFQKINAYHLFVQIGCIAQGALQFLCVEHSTQVWGAFRGWLRTMRKDITPSEQVASLALQSALPEFLAVGTKTSELSEIIGPNLALERLPSVRMAV